LVVGVLKRSAARLIYLICAKNLAIQGGDVSAEGAAKPPLDLQVSSRFTSSNLLQKLAVLADLLCDFILIGHDAPNEIATPEVFFYASRFNLYYDSVSDFFVRLSSMTGAEFIKKVKALSKKRGVPFHLNASRGKGSHQTLYYGSLSTVVRHPPDELKTGTFHAMCKQIAVKPSDL
jgi:mRNA interferase HicA